MMRLIPSVALAAVMTSCTQRTLPLPYGSVPYKSARLGAREGIREIVFEGNTNGTYRMVLKGYQGDLVEGLRVAVEGAVSGAIMGLVASQGGILVPGLLPQAPAPVQTSAPPAEVEAPVDPTIPESTLRLLPGGLVEMNSDVLPP